jgi:hypothetical protein
MKCRSCGHANEERNKFCGACGSPLQEERRRAERRIIAWEPQQCRSCGSMNSAPNRFCGMCGTALESERRRSDRRLAEQMAADVAHRSEPARIERTSAAERTPAVEPAGHLDDSNHAATSYLGAPSPSSSKPRGEWVRSSGSSFLGLEDEAPSNSEYLLEDEEQHKNGNGWRLPIALLILAAVGYLIFKNWDSPTFAAALSQLHKHTQDSSSTENSKPQPSSAEQPSISTDENAASSDTAKQSTPPASDANKPAPEASKASPTEPPATAPPSEADAKSKQDAGPKKNSADTAPAKDDGEADNSAPSEPEPKEPAASNPSSRPSNERSTPANATIPGQDLYERGQAYLSGHGAPQSCDQGVVYTRAAAQQGNPKAAVQMGALYATGRCVSQDRVQAYNWFNEALRTDPNNEYVERSRSTLWAQMTSEERQRASKESQ